MDWIWKLIDMFALVALEIWINVLSWFMYIHVVKQSDSKSRQMSKRIWSSVKRSYCDKRLEAKNRYDPWVGEISGDPITSFYRSAVEQTFAVELKAENLFFFLFKSRIFSIIAQYILYLYVRSNYFNKKLDPSYQLYLFTVITCRYRVCKSQRKFAVNAWTHWWNAIPF